MIPDVDIWRAALIMVKRYGDDAMLEAAARADQLQEEGDWQRALTWHRILDAIERLRAKAPRLNHRPTNGKHTAKKNGRPNNRAVATRTASVTR
jgi:hypothetical protein